jgi:phage gpG-like protein
MPISLFISTAGGDEIARVFATMRRQTEDWSGAWPGVSRKLRSQEAAAFRTEGSTGRAGRWAALSARYAAWKREHFPGRGILELTGRLRGSLTDESHPDSIEIRNPKFLFFGSKVPYAGFHQEGTETLKRRPPLSPTDRDVAEWVAEMHRYFDANVFKGVTGFGGRASVRRALTGA